MNTDPHAQARDLLMQAQEFRARRDRNAIPRTELPSLPESYWACVFEAQAWATLATCTREPDIDPNQLDADEASASGDRM